MVLIYSHGEPRKTFKKPPKTLFFLRFSLFLLVFAMFFYICSVAHMLPRSYLCYFPMELFKFGGYIFWTMWDYLIMHVRETKMMDFFCDDHPSFYQYHPKRLGSLLPFLLILANGRRLAAPVASLTWLSTTLSS